MAYYSSPRKYEVATGKHLHQMVLVSIVQEVCEV